MTKECEHGTYCQKVITDAQAMTSSTWFISSLLASTNQFDVSIGLTILWLRFDSPSIPYSSEYMSCTSCPVRNFAKCLENYPSSSPYH